MLFSSVEFLFFFWPASLALYFLVPLRLRNAALLFTSLLFYGWGEPLYVFLMVGTVSADYLFGLLVTRKHGRAWLITAVVFNLSLLIFFKYYDFFATAVGLSPLGIPLPAGISFYTFQALSYVVDVYRGEKALRDPVAFGAYISMFPQLVAGPIVLYGEIRAELEARTSTTEKAAAGLLRFLAGLGKKVLLANPAGEVFEHFSALAGDGLGALGAWCGAIFYALQIYFDFSAYSDMAVGLGMILGFSFPENFRYPYCAVSIRDFWRRWHITLSAWFREYVYLPLGGSRRGVGRTILNLFAVWALTGLWHGAGTNFLAWGLYYFLLIAAEHLFLGRVLERLPRALGRVYTLFFVLVGWVLFSAPDLTAAFVYLGVMFGSTVPVEAGEWYEVTRNLVPLAVMLVGCTPLPRRLFHRFLTSRPNVARPIALTTGAALLLFLCTAYLADASYNPFLYFRF
ncbi:MAG: MBOAT family protein [Clostridia bacterium]|nr:MBOAT family protein [Clostridia bacterium]